ncbi:MAG: carbamoyl-phosphate-synthetase [Allomuricauda sp.]|nr:MAG: carbamoyl-phosphate-synthetase [Allomuricauda sp.]
MSKKLIILGGNPETAVLVDVAITMGFYTIVIDMESNSPAKRNASKSYDLNVFDVDKIVQVAKEENVDAVLIGVVDVLVKPYKEICEKLGFPCYVTDKAVEAFCSKDGFKKYCHDYDIQDIPGIYLDENSTIEKPHGLEYPLMIKPVDRGGGVGMKICRDDSDYVASVKTAMDFSKKGVVLVERYMDCDDMAAYYTFQNGVAYVSAVSDRITTKKQGDASPVCIGAIFPSKHTNLFIEKMHPKLSHLFEGLGIQNGVLNIQFFVENNEIYAYDPGFRLQGEAPHIPIAHINGFDHREMLINYAFTGIFGNDEVPLKNDPRFKGNIACTIWVLLTDGVITSIEGMDEIKKDGNTVFVLERFALGDTVKQEWLGTERQVYARIYLVGDSIRTINRKIVEFRDLLTIKDANGDSMILEWLEPFDEKDYS